MSYFDSVYKIDVDYLKNGKKKMNEGGKVGDNLLSSVASSVLPGIGSMIGPMLGNVITKAIQDREANKSLVDARNQLNTQVNPYQMKKGGYLKDENTYVTKDGKETRRGLWANVYLKKKKDKRQDGGKINSGDYENFAKTLPDNLKSGSDFDMKYYWENSGKPKNFNAALFRGMFSMGEDKSYHAPSVDPKTLRFLKSKNHPTVQKELDWYNSKDAEAIEFRKKYALDKSGEYYKYVDRFLKPNMNNGGMIPNSMVDGGKMKMVSNDAQQVKANNPQKTDSVETPQAFLDHNEMVIDMPDGGKFVFSDYLKDSNTGESFSTIAKGLVEKRDSGELSDAEYNELINELANDNENAKTMKNNMKKKMMGKGGKMMYQQGGGMGMDPAMQGGGMGMDQGMGMEQGMAPEQGMEQGQAQGQAQPDIMPEMGVEGDMGMGAMTEEGFPVDMGNGEQFVFSPDLKEPNTGKSFAEIAQEITMMKDQGQIEEQEYMQAIQQLAQQQEQMKGGMSEEQKAGMKCGGYMKKKMGGGGYMSKDMFNKMYKP